MALTEQQKQAYNQHPYNCPYCGSSDIHSGSLDMDSTSGVAWVSCEDCEQEWKDIWQFSHIEEVKP